MPRRSRCWVGAILRREEAAALDLADLDSGRETLVVVGAGAVVRSVAGARRTPGDSRVVEVRCDEPGPLLTPMSKTVPRVAETGRRLSVNAVAAAVKRRFAGEDATVRPHDLRRTFVGDLLDAGADLSSVSKIVGHTTVDDGWLRPARRIEARRAAVEKLSVPFV